MLVSPAALPDLKFAFCTHTRQLTVCLQARSRRMLTGRTSSYGLHVGLWAVLAQCRRTVKFRVSRNTVFWKKNWSCYRLEHRWLIHGAWRVVDVMFFTGCRGTLCVYNEMLRITLLRGERIYLCSQFWVTVTWSVGPIALLLWWGGLPWYECLMLLDCSSLGQEKERGKSRGPRFSFSRRPRCSTGI